MSYIDGVSFVEQSVKPISPAEVSKAKIKLIPKEVIECFNKLIAKNFTGTESIITQDEIVRKIMDVMGCGRQVVYYSHWLDIEELYRDQGWVVTYDKPAHYESFDPRFIFKVPQ